MTQTLANDVAISWPEGLTRIPYQVYSDEALAKREQTRLFEGPTWSFLCLEAEIPKINDYATTYVGETPVIVARDPDGVINGFENRCIHRGAMLCLKSHGNTRRISCVYHNWVYDLKGNLTSVTFQKGINGKGGMPGDFDRTQHGLRTLRIAHLNGLLFGTFATDTPPLEEYLGKEIVKRVKRVMHKPVRVLGYIDQALPSNWKLYMENVKDPYHASLLHTFFTTFKLNRLSQPGGIVVSESGAHHVSYSMLEGRDPSGKEKASEYESTELRAKKEDYRLADPSILDGVDEIGDGISLQILAVFPNFILQQIQNALAVRKVLPKGVGRSSLMWTHFGYEDDDARLTEIRLKQSNLVGPAGYISMEDGAVGGFIQRGVAGAGESQEIIEMGGRGVDSGVHDTRATEMPIRGFWKEYRARMGL